METLGILLLLIGATILRQVTVGRAENIPADAKDLVLAIVQGRFADIGAITAQRGLPANAATPVAGKITAVAQSAIATANGNALLTKAMALGSSARGYLWAAQGPTYYDCSGLVWKSLYDLGIYTGPRFTTYSFPLLAGKFATKVSSPAVGDIVLWSSHMGIVSGPDQMYSAYSTASGIHSSTISGETPRHGTPTYWRLK